MEAALEATMLWGRPMRSFLILKKQAGYSLSVAVVSGCLPLFAELAQQIGGVAQSAEGVAKSLRSSEIRTLSVFTARR